MNQIHLGKNVSVLKDRNEHIKKHGFHMNVEEIVNLADRWTKGKQGLHVCYSAGNCFTIIIRGTYEENGKKYGIVRTIIDDEVRTSETELPIVEHTDPIFCKHVGSMPYIQGGFCPWCNK